MDLGGSGFRVYSLEFRVRDDTEAVGFRESFCLLYIDTKRER